MTGDLLKRRSRLSRGGVFKPLLVDPFIHTRRRHVGTMVKICAAILITL